MKRFLFVAFMAALALCGCKPLQVVEKVKTEYVRDTLQMRDSVYISRTQFVKGDSVLIHDTIATIRWRDRVSIEQRVDSIPYPVEVEKIVRRRNSYDRFTAFGFWTLLALLVFVCVARVIIRVYLRK